MPIYLPFIVLVLPFFIVLIILLIPAVRSQIRPEKYYRAIIFLSILLAGGFLIAFWTMRGPNEEKNYSFNGVIEKAYYEKPKEIPHITIKGVEYDLCYLNYLDYDTIVVGDIAIKKKGTLNFILIKKKK